MLDVCSYVGAWAVTAHGARRALGAVRGFFGATRWHTPGATRSRTACTSKRCEADAFDALKQLHEQGERFDVVILDPPAFIKRKKDIPQGQAAYRKLNQLALNLIERRRAARLLLLLLPPGRRRISPPPSRAPRATAARFVQILEAGGQSPGPSGASGDPGNALPEGLLLPGHARLTA